MSPRSRCSAKLWCLAGTGSMNRIEISFYQPAPTEIGCTVSVLFKVTNDTANQLPAQRLELIGDHYWRSSCSVAVPCIQPYSACPEFTLEMRCVNTTDPAKVPPTFQVRLTKSNLTSTLCWSFWTFTQRLRDYCPIGLPGANGAEKFVILCFGLAGSGKSSFSNSVLTLMHGGEVMSAVPFCSLPAIVWYPYVLVHVFSGLCSLSAELHRALMLAVPSSMHFGLSN